MINYNLMFRCLLVFFSFSILANAQNKSAKISVKNNLNFSRTEIVSVSGKPLLDLVKGNKQQDLRIKKAGTSEFVVLQWIDYNQDGIGDELLFQAEVLAKAKANYDVVFDGTITLPESKSTTYSRFVPERTDDYAWENDKVAFRTYGPDAQKRVEEKRPDGTLTSGIDLWLKRTDKSIINKWYAENVKKPGYYHIDHGEGYDPYQVGPSRGTGGSGIWENNELAVSKNFVSYKTIATGPLRTIFELTYAPWSSYEVKETKRISLDLGSNFSKFEITIDAKKQIPNYATGISLHENKGEVKINKKEGWFRHGETIDGVFLGEGIVLNPKLVTDAFSNVSKIKDRSDLLVITKPKENKLIYYAGFAWQKSGQIANATDWDTLLQKQSKMLANPLKITIKGNK
ncbi:protein of unknown function [Flavobacterium glycines]|uniref:DUF4861 domain-containing protein n=1 Tax=Flavobacterium glycines TaxID=551990 RepID=A0A1B9DPQ4_9FLAO|nr:DUF4861 family protein [Flavobacterium glycines]OCB71678.1 hypothetical protein FBGL_10690 [Flavobacterium glycines]SDI56844.1 protein of unknown function [Flavobacterium glycines]